MPLNQYIVLIKIYN